MTHIKRHTVSVGFTQIANVEVFASTPEEAYDKVQNSIKDMGIHDFLNHDTVLLLPVHNEQDIFVQHEETHND